MSQLVEFRVYSTEWDKNTTKTPSYYKWICLKTDYFLGILITLMEAWGPNANWSRFFVWIDASSWTSFAARWQHLMMPKPNLKEVMEPGVDQSWFLLRWMLLQNDLDSVYSSIITLITSKTTLFEQILRNQIQFDFWAWFPVSMDGLIVLPGVSLQR